MSPAVVTSSPALAEMICAIGARDHLVGVSRYCLYPPELGELPQIGGLIDPNLEAIDALSPDLCLLQGKDPRLKALAERRAFEVVSYEIETVEQTHEVLLDLGRRLGCAAEAKRESARLERAFAAARAAAPAVPPSVLLVFNHRPGQLGQVSSPGKGTFVSQCLEAAGGSNCLDDLPAGGWHTVAKEVLLAKGPELIIELSSEPVDAEAAAAMRADWQVLAALPAVKSGRIAIISGDELLIPATRLDQTVGKLARAIAGELDIR